MMKIFETLKEKLYWEGYFFFSILFLLVATTGVDRMVTGIIKPDVEWSIFLAYALWQTMLNQAIAISITIMYWIHSLKHSKYIAGLVYITTVWVWIGGALDFLYFMMAGQIPLADKIWTWMPFYWWLHIDWTIVHHAVYTIAWLIALAIAWYKRPRE